MLRTFWLCILMLGMIGVANAQFTAIIYYANCDIPLTMECAGGEPIPNGTTVEIYWDQNNNGPDEADELVPVGVGFGMANFNTFAMDENLIGCPGTFATEFAFSIVTNTPQPSRYWLRVCVLGQLRQWRSNSFTIADGLNEYDLSSNFNCVEEVCAGCLTPPGVGGVTASTNLCTNVTVTWNAYPNEPNVNTLRVMRDGVRIATVPRTQTSYIDNAGPFGNPIYGLIAARDCGPGDTAVSAPANAVGTRIQPPISVADTSFTAFVHPTQCGAVIVQWRVPLSLATIDSFCVFQNGIEVGRTGPGLPNTQTRDTVFTALSGAQNYTIAGWSIECGHGAQTIARSVTAAQPPAQVTGLTASTGLCQVNLSWTAVPSATSYIVRRNGSQIGTPVTNSFSDLTATPNVVFSYTVSAVNTSSPAACQEGPQSTSANGWRASSPTQPANVNASDSTDCFAVLVFWTDNSNDELGFIIRRDGVNIDSTDTNVNWFYDSTAVTGTTYSYTVAAFNSCGTSVFAPANVGSRSRIAPPVNGVFATDHLTDRIYVSWWDVVGESGYRIFRDGLLLAELAPDITFYEDFTATPLVEYLYTVIAYAPCGEGIPSSFDNGRIPCERPLAIQNFTVSQGECELTLTWNDLPNETYYVVIRDGQWRANLGQDITTFVDDQATGNTAYSYLMYGMNNCSSGPETLPVSGFRYTTPQSPTGVSATDSLCGQVTIFWNDVDYEDGYIVRRNGIVIGHTNPGETSFTYTLLSQRSAYRVQAFNPCGASFSSLADSGGIDILPTMLSLTTSSPDCDGITLTYSATSNTDSVKLYRDAALIAVQVGGIGSYEDTPPTSGGFTYSAQAVGDCGVSNVIGGVNGTLLEYPSGPTAISTTQDSCETITVNWVPATGDFGYYRVSRDGVELTTVSNSETTFIDPSAIGGIEYSYAVVAVNDTCGQSVDFDSVTAAIVLGSLPAAPEIVITIQNLDAVLAWSPIDTTLEGCPIAPSRYLVYYSENSNGPFFYHGSTTDTSYRHVEVVRFAADMYYQVETFVGPVALVSALPDGGALTRDEVMTRLRNRKTR